MYLALTWMPILADQADDAARTGILALFGGACVVFVFGLLVTVAVWTAICFILAGCLKRIPAEYRKQDPNMVWLLMIPVFNIVWNFFVWPNVAMSFKAYFDSVGRTDVGDCGKSLALAICICAVVSLLPYVGWACLSVATLVLIIITLVKFVGYKNQIPENPGSAPLTTTPSA